MNGTSLLKGMRVSEIIADGAVVVRPEWKTFDETVARMVHSLVRGGCLPAALAGDAVRGIFEREAIAGTAMVDIGVSIPHARLEGVDGIVAAMAVAPDAVYQVADGLPISIVVLVLSSPARSGEYLNFLSGVSMLLQSARNRERLRHATTVDEVLSVVRDSEFGRA
jgi:PTS system nitrogen regulatory IIA component